MKPRIVRCGRMWACYTRGWWWYGAMGFTVKQAYDRWVAKNPQAVSPP